MYIYIYIEREREREIRFVGPPKAAHEATVEKDWDRQKKVYI